MIKENQRILGRTIMAMTLLSAVVISSVGQAGPPTLSSNPGKHVIFPAKGQSPEQQKLDEAAAYDWACQQTSWDPYESVGAVAGKEVEADEAADSTRGSAVMHAAGGALLGLAIGAIAGDAGKGAAIGATAGGVTGGVRSHRTRKAANDEAGAASADYQQKFEIWDRNFVAAMEGKGYTVN